MKAKCLTIEYVEGESLKLSGVPGNPRIHHAPELNLMCELDNKEKISINIHKDLTEAVGLERAKKERQQRRKFKCTKPHIRKIHDTKPEFLDIETNPDYINQIRKEIDNAVVTSYRSPEYLKVSNTDIAAWANRVVDLL